MEATERLLVTIRDALRDNRIRPEEVPVAEIKQSVLSELQIHRNTFLDNQYTDVLKRLENLYANISDNESDARLIGMFIDSVVLCLNMISKAVQSLANGEYWCYKHQNELDDPEVLEIIDFIERERSISLLNYDFREEYEHSRCEVVMDDACGMHYIPYKGRRMYFPRGWEAEEISAYYSSVTAEQDSRSPHCYRKEGYEVVAGDVVVDAGAAEGIFALDVIDKASQIYLIEADTQWVEALEQTFRQDGDKVKIIYGFLDTVMEGQQVSIDGLFSDREINYIKMDIEGYEKKALLGAEQTISRSGNIRCAICTYHCREDEEWVRSRLEALGLETDVSRGYICPDWTSAAYLEAELRRGILFGRKG